MVVDLVVGLVVAQSDEPEQPKPSELIRLIFISKDYLPFGVQSSVVYIALAVPGT